ncbi:SDR family NAD(P)-dependent oxidoreductase [Pedobacter sp. Du54]|uniref:SDR family oxidoreductase n=1 Tax=Pedobacter anseongensis TaxID=3133439 RepID=UPI0030A3A9F5
MKIQGKTILITGGASGIGLEAARQFLEKGAKVIITGRNQNKLIAAKKQFPDLITIQSDVSSAEDAQKLFEKVSDLSGIDILYNNAGAGVAPINLGAANEHHVKNARYEMEVNYIGIIRLNNLFMEMLKSRKEAAIINTTSILSYVPSLVEATYSATKTALAFYTKALREHLRIINSDLKIFELLPPVVDTEMTASRTGKKLTPEHLVKGLISGLEKNKYTIRVGDSKIMYFLHRFFPKLAFSLVNPKTSDQYIKSSY